MPKPVVEPLKAAANPGKREPFGARVVCPIALMCPETWLGNSQNWIFIARKIIGDSPASHI